MTTDSGNLIFRKKAYLSLKLQKMPTEKEKMLLGEDYQPSDRELSEERKQLRVWLEKLNTSLEDEPKKRKELIKKIVPSSGKSFWMQPPFYCDYGYNITVGKRVFFNFNCVVLDSAPVRIGTRTLIGPNVQIYTVSHPLNHQDRATGKEFAKPINIGEDVWIGGSAVICPGVHIGNRSVIGAGSVVIKDIPPDVFAAGNPCKVIRSL